MPVIWHSQSLYLSLAPFKPLLHGEFSFTGSWMKLHAVMLQQQAESDLAQGMCVSACCAAGCAWT